MEEFFRTQDENNVGQQYDSQVWSKRSRITYMKLIIYLRNDVKTDMLILFEHHIMSLRYE